MNKQNKKYSNFFSKRYKIHVYSQIG